MIQCDTETERGIAISSVRWMQQRMSHVSRTGPGCRPGFVFGVLLREMMSKLKWSRTLSKRGKPKENTKDDNEPDENDAKDVTLEAEEQRDYLLALIPGTDKYLELKREELETQAEWYGPPTLFITLTFSATTDDVLACLFSHSRKEEEDFQVWHESEENTMLQLRPGKTLPSKTRGGGYFVHTKTARRYDNCPFHLNCSRDTLMEASARY